MGRSKVMASRRFAANNPADPCPRKAFANVPRGIAHTYRFEEFYNPSHRASRRFTLSVPVRFTFVEPLPVKSAQHPSL